MTMEKGLFLVDDRVEGTQSAIEEFQKINIELADYAAIKELTAEPEIVHAIAAVETPKTQKFLELLRNPDVSDKGIAALARKAGLTPTQLADIWRDYVLRKSFLIGLREMPEIVKGIADNAKSSKVVCPRCDGATEIEVRRQTGMTWITCPNCDGQGTVSKPGDAHSRTLMFKRVGWLKDGGGVQVVVNQGNQISVESVIEEMDSGEAIDADYEAMP